MVEDIFRTKNGIVEAEMEGKPPCSFVFKILSKTGRSHLVNLYCSCLMSGRMVVLYLEEGMSMILKTDEENFVSFSWVCTLVERVVRHIMDQVCGVG